MRVYVGHPSSINYEEDLYRPLRNSELNDQHTIIFPHEDSDEPFNSKDFLKDKCDIFIAEVSEASTGLGIELGWAEMYDVPIICVYREDSRISSSLTRVSNNIQEYQNTEELVKLVKNAVKVE